VTQFLLQLLVLRRRYIENLANHLSQFDSARFVGNAVDPIAIGRETDDSLHAGDPRRKVVLHLAML